MSNYATILSAARSLPPHDQLQLIDALWDELPGEADSAHPPSELHPAWQPEIERRVQELQAGTVPTTDWEEIRATALARLENGHAN